MFRTIRTPLLLSLGIIITVAVSLLTILGIVSARKIFLELALHDVDSITEQLVRTADPIAIRSKDEADFAEQAGPEFEFIREEYFSRWGMSGYVASLTTEGTFIYHPSISRGTHLIAVGRQGEEMLRNFMEVGYNGTIFYQWRNPGTNVPGTSSWSSRRYRAVRNGRYALRPIRRMTFSSRSNRFKGG